MVRRLQDGHKPPCRWPKDSYFQRKHSKPCTPCAAHLAFAGHEIYQRAAISLQGTVVSSETSCVQPYNNRCDTRYVVEAQDQTHSTYIAGPTDESLERRLPVGTFIRKDKWALTYSVNNQKVSDFPVVFYGGLMAFGVLVALFGRPSSKKKI